MILGQTVIEKYFFQNPRLLALKSLKIIKVLNFLVHNSKFQNLINPNFLAWKIDKKYWLKSSILDLGRTNF